jgi:hypothetical protein
LQIGKSGQVDEDKGNLERSPRLLLSLVASARVLGADTLLTDALFIHRFIHHAERLHSVLVIPQ